ncbi:histone-lysine N-methyltransferase ATXR2 isoform X2 [Phalaenopsis equestris]|uniref:histone-lysine N-methyltransferase ATXR2 isoform X2 n=1 Tax=Phalaenopsis equestris TaxID=78828 RepID=UPI0009E4E0B1|nr:histone-lysine N-methyltransferase ATXR2 isoform X2 [Phalaenopsis equestris]
MEASPCPLDAEFADQIAALLTPPSPLAIQEYYDELKQKGKCNAVRIETSKVHGKGVFSNMEFKEGELILKDQILVAAQHSSNKVDCFVCSSCFRFVGSVELQIGRKLYLQSLGLSVKKECDHQIFFKDAVASCSLESQNEDDLLLQENSDNAGQSSCSENSPSKEVLELLMNGKLSLPFSEQFLLPPIVPCPGGCEEEHYCSKVCADSDWESIHSLLCTGKSSGSLWQAAAVKFTEHANRTNDIFILAAKVISFVILRYRRLKQSQFESSKRSILHNSTDDSNFFLLLEAWKPIAMGFKRRWWDCIALPDDLDNCDEALFREQIRDMAFSSLQLLKEAIFDIECAPLFSLEIYGHIIGMFELNNLDLVVASPVEDYFIYIDDLPSPQKEKAELTLPFLDALGDDYSDFCQGTAFFPIQSCMNHSCCPNAKAFKRDEDRDGQAVIIAVSPISIGEEITISYIDEDLPYEERQALLADYGFKCSCRKCRKEQLFRQQ